MTMTGDAKLLGLLDRDTAKWMMKLARQRVVQKRDVLIRQGAQPTSFFVVIHGSMDVYADGALVGQLERGDMVGEVSYLDGGDASATVLVSSEEAAVLEWNRTQLEDELFEQDDGMLQFTAALGTIVAGRLRQQNAISRIHRST
jgi:CRP-like cAMP-binding protein